MKKHVVRNVVVALVLAIVGAVAIPTIQLALSPQKQNKLVAHASLAYRLDNLFGGQVLKKTTAEKLKEAEEKKKELEAQKNKYQAELDAMQTEYDDLRDYIQEMDTKQNEIMTDMLEIEAELVELNAELTEAKANLEVAEQVQAKQYESMKNRLQYIYENGDVTYIEILLSSKSLSDLLNQMEYVEKITEYDNKLLTQYIEAKQKADDHRAFLEAQIDTVELTQEMYETDLAYVEEVKEIKGAAVAEYEEKMGAHHEILEEYLDEIAEQKLTIEEIEQQIAEEIKKREEEERLQQQQQQSGGNKNDYSNVPNTGYNNAANIPKTDEKDPSKMIWPLPGDPYVGDGFGYRVPPCPGASTYHKGVDIGGKLGAQIVASLAGTVYEASWNSTGGYHVYIDHGNGYITRYLHCSKLLVSKGDYVQQGEVIALCGSTGVSTGAHLHFSVYKNGVPVDPLKYVKY